MFHKTVLSATTLAAIALGASGAVSAAAAHDSKRETEALHAAPTSLTQALAIAEKQTGGRALRADFEKENGSYVYEIRTASGDRISRVLVDPATGKTSLAKAAGLLDRLGDSLATVSLASAVAAAEARTGGKAMEAAYDDADEHEGATIRVDVTKDAKMHRVVIDGTSGKVVKVTGEDDDESEE